MNDDNIETKVIQIKLDDIIPNRFQPREIFDENGLEELAESIKEHGVIQPIIVRRLGDKYELIAGERRTKASAIAGKTTIPAIIKEMDDRESAKVSLLENLQRKNLSAIEEARTYKRILELENMTQEELARTMGRSQPMVANKLRLLSLPEEVQEALMKNQISERHARSLLTIQDKKEQLKFLERIKNERLTVRELDSEIKKYKNEEKEIISESTDDSKDKEDKERFMNNNRSNFGGMGLNDYQSGVNNMFNNIPNNYNNVGNQDMLSNGGLNYNAPNSFNNQNIMSNNDISENENNSSSLGFMFDGVQNNDMLMSNNTNNNDDNNLFISQIKDSATSKKENQFLPDFDNVSTTNNNFNVNENFNSQPLNNFVGYDSFDNMNTYQQSNMNSSIYMNDNSSMFNQPMMQNNEFRSMDNTMYNENKLNNDMNMNNNQPVYSANLNVKNVSNDNLLGNFDFYGNPVASPAEAYHPSYETNINNTPVNNDFSMNGFEQYNQYNVSNSSIPDFGPSNNNYAVNPNNGGLFNQPLNIVGDYEEKPIEEPVNNDLNSNVSNIPSNQPIPSSPIEVNNNYQVENNTPVAPLPEFEEKEETTNTPDIEIIGDEVTPEISANQEPKNEYIKLEEEITIHNIHDAVMELKKTTDKIKQNHINIETEEIEFDDIYQITIKLKKEDN